MKTKAKHFFLANAILVMAVFFLFLLILGWVLPTLTVFRGAFVQGALAVFSILSLLFVVSWLSQIPRSWNCRQDEIEQNGNGR